MRSTEKKVKKSSDYYVYTPSVTARELMFYPTILGHFEYEPGYFIHRTHFGSFLLMLIESGECDLILHGKHISAKKDQLVLVDCYDEHQYGSRDAWSCLWLHFDGKMARPWYDYISKRNGHVITPANPENIRYMMNRIYRRFKEEKPADEAAISSYISLILAGMLTDEASEALPGTAGIQQAITYINEHFSEPIQLKDMADAASLSPYYFSRLFTKETGLTPHQYLIATRISSAKYLLSYTGHSVKEICFRTGFSDVSTFCSTFRKKEGVTPSSYRNRRKEAL